MRAKPGVEGDVTWLLESPDEVARFQHGLENSCGATGISAQIAVAQVGGKQRGPAGQVEDDVAGRTGVVARWAKRQHPPRGRRCFGELVDHQVERPQMSLDTGDPTLCNRTVGATWRRDHGWWRNQHGDVEMLLQQIASLNGGLVAAVDQDDPAAFQLDHWRRCRDFGRGGQQRCHLRPSAVGVTGPSGGLADIGKLYRIRTIIFVRNPREQRGLLRAGDRKRTILDRNRLKSIKLGTAKLRRCRHFAATAATNCVCIERHRPFA